MDIELQAFSKDNSGTTLYVYNYIMLSADGNFAVTLTTDNADFDSDLNSEDNPVKTIFDTVQVS